MRSLSVTAKRPVGVGVPGRPTATVSRRMVRVPRSIRSRRPSGRSRARCSCRRGACDASIQPRRPLGSSAARAPSASRRARRPPRGCAGEPNSVRVPRRSSAAAVRRRAQPGPRDHARGGGALPLRARRRLGGLDMRRREGRLALLRRRVARVPPHPAAATASSAAAIATRMIAPLATTGRAPLRSGLSLRRGAAARYGRAPRRPAAGSRRRGRAGGRGSTSALGGLGVGDRGADHGVEHLVVEVLLQRGVRLARVHGAHVGDVQQDAEPLQVRVVELLACSITSSAPSTPCSAKYCASEEISAQSAATRPLMVSRPSAGGQSMRTTSWRSRSFLSAF